MLQAAQGLIILLSCLILVLPKRMSLYPLWIGFLFIPFEYSISLGSLSLYSTQIMGVAGMLRLLFRGEMRPINYNVLEKTILAWLLCGAIVYSLLRGSQGVIWKAGRLMEFIPCYLFIRHQLRAWDDVLLNIKAMLYMSIFLFPLVIYEHSTGVNPFGTMATEFREGRLRCAASFSHPILFGSFAASMVPIIWALMQSERRKSYWIFIIIYIFFVYASASSGPVLSLIFGIVFLWFFRYRRKSKQICLYLIAGLFCLQFIMNSPIWFIIGRVNIVGGSTGWHRAVLIDQTIRHFSEWAILGLISCEHWGVWAGDVTNQYILEGLWGGIVGMVLFIAILFQAVKSLGVMSIKTSLLRYQWFLWGFCCSILVDCVSFMSVSLFGQMTLYFIFFLVVAAMAKDCLNAQHYNLSLGPSP